jgi:hypothetical protein
LARRVRPRSRDIEKAAPKRLPAGFSAPAKRGSNEVGAAESFDAIRDASVNPEQTAGVSGVASFNGYVRSYETDPSLAGSRRYKTYSEMQRNNPIVGLGVRYRKALVSKPQIRVVPKDASSAAREAALFVEEVLADMATPVNKVLARMAMTDFHGFSVHEWTAKSRDDGRIGLLDIESRPQATIERWDLDAFGTVHGVVQRSPQTGAEHYLPIGKCVHLVDDSDTNSPEGHGIFRDCVSSSKIFMRYRQLEGFGYETDLRGIPIAGAPLGELNDQLKSNDPKKKQAAIDAIANIEDFMRSHVKQPDAGFMLDSATYTDNVNKNPSSVPKWSIRLLDGGATTAEEVGKSIEREALYLAALLGIEHILIGGSNRGSQALSRDKAMSYALICDAQLSDICDALVIQVLRPLFELNGMDRELIPDLVPRSSSGATSSR